MRMTFILFDCIILPPYRKVADSSGLPSSQHAPMGFTASLVNGLSGPLAFRIARCWNASRRRCLIAAVNSSAVGGLIASAHEDDGVGTVGAQVFDRA